jgi:hypothetical protein
MRASTVLCSHKLLKNPKAPLIRECSQSKLLKNENDCGGERYWEPSSGAPLRFCFSLAQGVYAWDDSVVISVFSPIHGLFAALK